MQDALHALDERQNAELFWVKPKWSRLQFELHANDAVVATLAWERGSRALAQWGESQYRFSRQGWLRPRVLVCRASAAAVDELAATLTYRSGMLTLPDGRTFVWKKPARFTRERIWVDSARTELIRFRPAKRSTVAVHVLPEAAHLPKLALLVLLGQYLLVLARQDEEAATTGAIAAVVASS